jgi:hypothetical protein
MLTKSLNFGIHRSGPRLEGLKSLKGEFLSQDLIIARASLQIIGKQNRSSACWLQRLLEAIESFPCLQLIKFQF